MRAKNLADLYDLPLVDWRGVTARLDETFWFETGKEACTPRIGRAWSTNRASP